MKVNLIKIGDSKGIRIPAAVIKQCGLKDQLELRVEDGVIVLEPVRSVRAGWTEAFERMSAVADNEFLIEDVFEEDVGDDGWTW